MNPKLSKAYELVNKLKRIPEGLRKLVTIKPQQIQTERPKEVLAECRLI